MFYFSVRFEVLRDKGRQLDSFLERAKSFWLAQPHVREFHVYSDFLIDWPERTIIIGVGDLASLERILDSEERKQLRAELLMLVKHPVWQLLELKSQGDLGESTSLALAALGSTR